MTVTQAQHLLAYLGSRYNPGSVDGVLGPRTRKALAVFQKAVGLPPDGVLTEDTQAALRHGVTYGLPVSEPDTFWEEIEYFTREEFRCPCGKCGGFPVEPDETLVREVNAMRGAFGLPVIIVPPDGHSGGSGIRCQAYNDSLPGSVPNSRHVLGKAVDFSSPGTSVSTIEVYLSRAQAAGRISYWYKISRGNYHMEVG